ncbi:MAG: sensor histidine kinase, partial [Novosphingobium sp.]
MTAKAIAPATGLCDGDDRLVAADEPLLGLHLRCGGELPGTIAVPALLEAVRKSRRFGMKLARPVVARDGSDEVTAWIEVDPLADGMSRITVRHWHLRALPPEIVDSAAQQAQIDCDLAEFHARLDPDQAVLTAQAEANDLKLLVRTMLAAPGKPWFDMVSVEGAAAGQVLHWR